MCNILIWQNEHLAALTPPFISFDQPLRSQTLEATELFPVTSQHTIFSGQRLTQHFTSYLWQSQKALIIRNLLILLTQSLPSDTATLLQCSDAAQSDSRPLGYGAP